MENMEPQVTPQLTKNDKLSKANYRPVTVLPAINNIFLEF